MVLHIRIVSATSMTVIAILPVLTISTILFVCATPCNLNLFNISSELKTGSISFIILLFTIYHVFYLLVLVFKFCGYVLEVA